MKITIFGAGYVGLVQAAVFADAGHDVLCVDLDADKVDRLNRGQVPIFEPGLEALVRENHESGRLSFTTEAASAVRSGEVQFIAVGTPPDEDGSADLRHVMAVADSIASSGSTRPMAHAVKNPTPNGGANRPMPMAKITTMA